MCSDVPSASGRIRWEFPALLRWSCPGYPTSWQICLLFSQEWVLNLSCCCFWVFYHSPGMLICSVYCNSPHLWPLSQGDGGHRRGKLGHEVRMALGDLPSQWSQEALLWSQECDRSWMGPAGNWRSPKLGGPRPPGRSHQNLFLKW